ncbi:LpqB family beta-propeller domain-containing protein [Kineococcus sp. SYSU DK005]|uniref:LpqB family beta-propeller domain-containing protein n=1 Tax=Kineococcus sp. SYSU DK005 TaxID=3383126 RepID=UPI003D7CE3DE
MTPRAPGSSGTPGPPRRAVVALALAAVSGCAGLPRSGPVVAGSRVQDDPRLGLVRVVPQGPVPGAAPEEVVHGFLLAAATGGGEQAVAREFLSPGARRTWRPDASTTLLRAVPRVRAAGPPAAGTAAVVVSGDVVAEIDAGGRYSQRPAGTALQRTLRLVRVEGEWRVDVPGDGRLLTQVDASRSLRPFPVCFATVDAAQLVADVRWFAYDSSTATRAVTELLAGPSPWLAPAVLTGAPPGTRLRTGTVPVADGTATVDLTAPALRAAPERRAVLLAQLRAGLTRLPGVEDVVVRVDGAELTRGSSPPVPDPPLVLPVTDVRLVLVGPSGVARWDRSSVQPVPGAAGAAAGARHPAVAPDGSCTAWLVDEGRTLRVQAGREAEPVAVDAGGAVLAPPSIDRHGWVWVVPTTAGAAPAVVRAQDPAGGRSAVEPPAEGLGGRVLRARPSRDGARLLLVRQETGGAVHVQVRGVVRGAAGRPLRLAGASPELVPGAGEVLDASWLGDDRVVVLVRPGPGQDPVPLVSQLSGPAQRLAPVPGAESVACGWNDREVVVGTSAGRLLTRSGATWSPVLDGRDPAYPG